MTIVFELFTHPPCSHLEPNGRITPSASPGGLAGMSWPGRLSFHTLSNGKSVLVNDTHNPGSALELLPSPPTNGLSNLTYTLGLSHSPPKQPLDTLALLFSPSR